MFLLLSFVLCPCVSAGGVNTCEVLETGRQCLSLPSPASAASTACAGRKRRKRRNKRSSGRTTRPWFDDLGLKIHSGVSEKKIFASPQQTSGLILRDYFNKFLQELYSVKESETKAKYSYILDHIHEWVFPFQLLSVIPQI